MQNLVVSLALALAALFALPITPAQAMNNRSWVASFGSGSACTRAAPCADFSTALGQTVAGGEINCVDQGEFSGGSALTIGQSVTIDCEGVQGRFGVTFSVSPVIIVQASATDVV